MTQKVIIIGGIGSGTVIAETLTKVLRIFIAVVTSSYIVCTESEANAE